MNLILPGEPGYDLHRKPLSPSVDPRPAMVVEAFNAGDVQSAVLAARRLELPFAVQATGHGTHVPADGAMLLKTTAMAHVLVDPDRRVARVGPGARWADVLAAAAPFGLAPLSGSSPTVGVTGYTLGGGLGWLGRKFGFAADSVLRAKVVTADGELVVASPSRHPELFWALRGGGGNFGVVTALEFQLHPVARVYAGMASFAIGGACDFLSVYRDWLSTAPDELSTAVVLRTLPDSQKVLTVKAMYAGDASSARRHLAPLWAAAGPALTDELRPMTYAQAVMGGTAARYFDFFRDLPDPAIAALTQAHRTGEVSNVEVRHWGGALGRGDGPAARPEARLSVIADTAVPSMCQTLRRYGMGGTFLNFLADPSRVATAFTPVNFRRLQQVKAAYDPDNFFRINHNIAPAALVGVPAGVSSAGNVS
ncbi:FAD-linked oxidase [Rhizocola hellebori]|uniref:FAD-linked oxidase n=1 Tax=Rhizocola hellebori TaxID=1392758 RepID=A0A8J3QDH8_9ACTN|nr:FAD-dependent oxidoreductase [Rhizocola hellebori]GIH08042.1 FAD-linked oxidase [Rhizocola hellebori]